MDEQYNTLYNNILDSLNKNKCKNINPRDDEFCITFSVNNEKHYDKIKNIVNEEENYIMTSSKKPKRKTSIKKIRNKCTLNFII